MSETLETLPPTIKTVDFIAGVFGGIAGVVAGHPFDTLKVRLQASQSAYKGVWDCLSKTVKQEKISGLYKGMASPLIGVGFLNSIIFGVYGTSLEFINSNRLQQSSDDLPKISSIFYAGCISGFANSIVANPMELIKIRLQNQTSHLGYSGPIDCIQKIIQNHGARGLFKGFWMTALRDSPSYGVYFASYELFTRYIYQHHQPKDGSEPTLWLLFAGGSAGVAGWISTYPVDVVKTRAQLLENEKNPDYKSIARGFKALYRSGGTRVFFSGLGATIVRAFPTNACTFYAYLWVKNYLEDADQRKA